MLTVVHSRGAGHAPHHHWDVSVAQGGRGGTERLRRSQTLGRKHIAEVPSHCASVRWFGTQRYITHEQTECVLLDAPTVILLLLCLPVPQVQETFSVWWQLPRF